MYFEILLLFRFSNESGDCAFYMDWTGTWVDDPGKNLVLVCDPKPVRLSSSSVSYTYT